MTLIVEVRINSNLPLELVTVRRIIDTRELTNFDPELCGDLQYYEVTRYSRNADGHVTQWGEPTHVHHDPDDGAIRLAYVALEAVHEGESRDDAWLDAKREADSEIEEVVETKDEYIGRQSDIIMACMEVFTATASWGRVPEWLHEELRNYV